MTPDSTDRRMQSHDPHSPLGGLSPADLLRQGAAEDTLLDGAREAFEPPSLLELAAIFPQFEILELIGQGGMGAVYKVRQRQLDRVVALKILPPGIGGDGAFADRFAREAKALAKLNHPGIVTIHEFGCSGGLYFIVMEFVDGVNLRQLLKGGRISPREALAIVPQICDALQFAHDLGIVHRDIKPENLLIDRRGRLKVADFGLAKLVGGDPDEEAAAVFACGSLLTEGGKVMGTPRYMAPEQIERPAEVDHRADIYALGVVFYQMLTGELPGERLEAPSRKVSVDVRLDEIVLRALEKDPELRFQQASVMKTRVEETREDRPAGGAKSPVPKRALAGIVLQAVALLLLLTGLRDVWKTPEGVQTVGIYELTGNQVPMELEAGMKEILTKLDPGAALARTADGKQWWVSVVAADADAGGIHRRFEDEVLARFGDLLEVREMRTMSAAVAGKMALLKPRWLLAGAWAGAIGAALLAISPAVRPGTSWRWAGPLSLGIFLAALLGTGGLLVLNPSDRDSAFTFGSFALLAASAFGVVGWRSPKGRAVVLGASALVFAWVVAVPWEFIRFPHGPGRGHIEVKGHQPHPSGFEVLAPSRGDSPDPSMPLAEPPSNITPEVRERFNYLIRDLAIHEVRHGENHPTTRERSAKLEAFLDEHPGLPDAEMCLSAPLQHTEALKSKREQELSGMGPQHPKSVMIDAQLKAAELTLALCASRRRETREGMDVEKP